ncbi:MAG: Crp/Fnr family transcriptional regulator [Chitinophagaceae bacterium]|nr:MAG: Crp/Fnr family transcriptional regulator [Chitinophagaceae bacterium]
MRSPVNEQKYLEFIFHYLHSRVGPISREQFDLFTPFFIFRSFGKKEIILNKDEVDDHLNVVAEGLVRKYVVTGKNEVTIQLATEGHIIQSEISFHKRVPSEVILETIEASVLVSMTFENVQKILAQIPIAEALGRAMVTQMFIKKDSRYFNQLGKTTREKFLDYITNHPHMMQRVPQKILASYLNIKPETFSRLKHLTRVQK